MFPLYSDRPLNCVPFVTVLLIIANLTAFWFQITTGTSWAESLHASVTLYGLVPARFLGDMTGMTGRLPVAATLLTSMFMHGGIMHLVSNMLFLWVFGRNVEDDFGHVRFLVFYLAAGLLATIAFTAAFPGGTVPLVGASGAIAGVLGVFFLRFPGARIHTMFILIIFIKMFDIPAFFMLGFWFAMQIGSCMVSYVSPEGAAGQGGVAWISHVAGFTVGLVWTIFELRRRYYAHGGR